MNKDDLIRYNWALTRNVDANPDLLIYCDDSGTNLDTIKEYWKMINEWKKKYYNPKSKSVDANRIRKVLLMLITGIRSIYDCIWRKNSTKETQKKVVWNKTWTYSNENGTKIYLGSNSFIDKEPNLRTITKNIVHHAGFVYFGHYNKTSSVIKSMFDICYFSGILLMNFFQKKHTRYFIRNVCLAFITRMIGELYKMTSLVNALANGIDLTSIVINTNRKGFFMMYSSVPVCYLVLEIITKVVGMSGRYWDKKVLGLGFWKLNKDKVVHVNNLVMANTVAGDEKLVDISNFDWDPVRVLVKQLMELDVIKNDEDGDENINIQPVYDEACLYFGYLNGVFSKAVNQKYRYLTGKLYNLERFKDKVMFEANGKPLKKDDKKVKNEDEKKGNNF